MKQYKIRYTKKVTKTIVATESVTADSPEQARGFIAHPRSGLGKVINTEIEVIEFEVKEEIDIGGGSVADIMKGVKL